MRFANTYPSFMLVTLDFTALIELRHDRVFGSNDNFVIIWIPDSDDEIIYQSAKALNSVSVYETYMSVFGE